MVQVSELTGDDYNLRSATTGLSAKFCGLSPNTTYIADVVSLNPAGAAFSDNLYFTTTAGSAVTNPSITSTGSGSNGCAVK